ncbi:hypothetical protein OAV70_04550, partial [Gammaproteobacteria bacterium]|nr:hypothetical protein [Gammaproteobacteria bacterium]
MNKFSISQYLLILFVLVLGFTYALPNLYPTQPSIQVAYTDSGKSADQVLLNELEAILENNQVGYEELFLRDGKIVIKFSTLDQQLESKTILQNKLLDKVIIALNLEPTTPDWLKNLGGKPVKLGLDLSGGVHFLLEVDIDTAQQGRLELLLDTYRKTFKEDKIQVANSSIKDLVLYFQFKDKESYNKALSKYRLDSPGINGLQYIITERPASNSLLLEYSDIALREIRDYAVGQNLITLRNRVNELGVLSGPNLAREIADNKVAGTVIASSSNELITNIKIALSSESFKIYSSNDVQGVELAGALKNIYAIICGMADSLNVGENAVGLILTRSMAEMSRFAVAKGANPITFLGLAGMGDLVATCTSNLSRNFQLGTHLGTGLSLDEAKQKVGQVAEGL